MIWPVYKTGRSLAVVLSLVLLGSCGVNEWRAQEAKLDLLVKTRATREQTIQALGTSFVDYSVRSTNRWGLEAWLQREPTNKWVEIREKVERYPNVLFYSTPWIMTWVFLDEHDKVADYALTAQ